MAELFGRDKSVVAKHLAEGVCDRRAASRATVAGNATVQRESDREVTRQVEHHNLDAILSAGYRVNSKRRTQLRI
jgi:hypothetical protein